MVERSERRVLKGCARGARAGDVLRAIPWDRPQRLDPKRVSAREMLRTLS